jgi:hypothetical protein
MTKSDSQRIQSTQASLSISRFTRLATSQQAWQQLTCHSCRQLVARTCLLAGLRRGHSLRVIVTQIPAANMRMEETTSRGVVTREVMLAARSEEVQMAGV